MDDRERLDEWTIQMAAGADPLTAWASLPPAPKPARSNSSYGAAIFAAVIFVWVLWLLK